MEKPNESSYLPLKNELKSKIITIKYIIKLKIFRFDSIFKNNFNILKWMIILIIELINKII